MLSFTSLSVDHGTQGDAKQLDFAFIIDILSTFKLLWRNFINLYNFIFKNYSVCKQNNICTIKYIYIFQ